MARANTQKGNAYELEAKKALEQRGWIVFRQHRKQMYIQGKMIMVGCDVFGCDMIAKKPGEKTMWIQVSVRSQKSAKIKQIMEFPWMFEHERAQLWLREERKRQFEVFEAPSFESIGIVNSI